MFHIRRTVLAFAAMLLSAETGFAAPAVTLVPVAGPPTTDITVNGTGFGPNAAVDIFFDTSDLCLALASGAGAIDCVIRAPSFAQPQAHWISAVQRSWGTGAQKAFTVRTDMAQFHGRNAVHSGTNPFENTISPSNVASLDTLWSVHIGSATNLIAAPVVAGGNVYVGGLGGKLYGFNALTGAPMANFPKILPGAGFLSSPSVGGGNVYIASENTDGALYGFNASTGTPVSGFPVILSPGFGVQPSPAFAAGQIFVADGSGKFDGLNASTGAPLPNFPVTLTFFPTSASANVLNGTVYVGSSDSKFYAFDIATGAAAPNFPLTEGGAIRGTAAIAGGTVYFGADDNKLHAVRASDGSAIPGFPVSVAGGIESSPAVSGGRVFVSSLDSHVYAFNAVTGGAALWTATLDSLSRESPVVANGVVYVNTPARLYALSAATGAMLGGANIKTVDAVFTAPVVANGIVYVASSDGNLYALSVSGLAPASRLAGGSLGVRPAMSMLKPDYALKPAPLSSP